MAVRVLVTFALENEFAPWQASHDFKPAKLGDLDVSVSDFASAQVTVALTGVGARQAALAASQIMRGEFDAFDCCISSGLAGGLQSNYGIGEVLAARSVFSEAVPTDGATRLLLCSAALVSFAAECGATVVEQFYSADHVISTAREKQVLSAKADAVEMESFEILREAQGAGVPAVAIRSISDTLDEDLPLDMSEILTAEGQVSIPRVLGQVALKPQSLPGLVRLGKNSRVAAQSLSRFLDTYVAALANRTAPLETKLTAGAF
jgi:adenosylhomocysteine nucleosidase